MMHTLHAGSLVLEPQTMAHAEEMFEVLGDPAIYEFENNPPKSLAWLSERFAKLESRASADGSEQWLNWVIRLPSGALAGYVQASVQHDQTAHIAYELASKYWRQGVGTTAVVAMLDELSARYGVATFVATLKAKNFRSLGLLQRLGFALTSSHDDELVMQRQGSAASK